jgi:hypothetical protein
MKKQTDSLLARLANHRNRLARFYDNGVSFDRFTAAYLAPQSNTGGQRWFWYRGMSTHPFDPQGFGCSGESTGAPVDYPVASLGRRNHLGKRIRFADLPPDCQRLVVQDLIS